MSVVVGSCFGRLGQRPEVSRPRTGCLNCSGLMVVGSTLTPTRMAASSPSHLAEECMLVYFAKHSFQVGGSLGESLAGTTVHEVI